MWRGYARQEGCGWVFEKRVEQGKERENVGGFLKREREGFVILFFLVRVIERESESERNVKNLTEFFFLN